jgi:hypothetical protein
MQHKEKTVFTMRASLFIFALHTVNSFNPVQSFQQHASLNIAKRGTTKETALAAKQTEEDYNPEVSFGAESVPDGQRPVNEYLDMRQAPLFDWGSNEVGVNGVSVGVYWIS